MSTLTRLAAIVVAVGVIVAVRPGEGRDASAERLAEELIPEEERREDAAEVSTKAIEPEPDHPNVLAHAYAHRSVGNARLSIIGPAIDDARASIELEPDVPKVLSRANLRAGPADESVPLVDGARVSSTSTYRLDTDRDVVEVVTEYTMTNVSPNRELGGGAFEYYFYDGMAAPLHPEVRELTVLVNDRPASFDIEPGEGLDTIMIDFGSDLRFNQTYTIDVGYHLAGSEPRSTTNVARVNEAYASFDVFAFADDNEATVAVLIPEGWEVERSASDFQRTIGFGQQVYEAAKIARPLDFLATFAARSDDALKSRAVTAGDAEFVLHAWPSDGEWVEYATAHIEHGIPALEELIGLPWPETGSSDMYESSSVYLTGYAGFHDTATNEIEVGEYFDSETMLHELSHAWFTYPTVDARWISEGLAQLVALRALDRLEIPLESIDDLFPDEVPSPEEIVPFQLNTWSPDDFGDDAVEEYGYETSAMVMEELADDIDDDALTDLLTAVVSGHRAYPTDGPDHEVKQTVGWKQFLDLAEQIGQSTEIESLYRQYVVADGDGSLDRRNDALDDYDELAERGGEWAPPEAVRGRMATWDFNSVEGRIVLAHEALDMRDELEVVLGRAGLEVPADLAAEYHHATDLTQLIADLDSDVVIARRLVDRQHEGVELLASLDLESVPLKQGDYESDAGALDDRTGDVLVGARELVDIERRLDAVVSGSALEIPELAPTSFMEDPAATVDARAELLVAATAVVDAREQRLSSAGFVDWLGRLGRSIDDDLDAAVRHLADGDPAAAAAAAESASADLEAAAESGPQRLAASVIAVALIAIMMLIVLMVRRRRSRRDDEIVDLGGPTDDPTDDPTDRPPDDDVSSAIAVEP